MPGDYMLGRDAPGCSNKNNQTKACIYQYPRCNRYELNTKPPHASSSEIGDEIINGMLTEMSPNETKANYCCPCCGADVIIHHGCSMSIHFCSICDWSDEDYDMNYDS